MMFMLFFITHQHSSVKHSIDVAILSVCLSVTFYYNCYYYKCRGCHGVLPSHSCGGTLQNLHLKLLHSSTQTSADHQSGQRQVSHMTDEKGETWSPSGMSKVRSRPESLVADCSVPALPPLGRRGR